MDAPDFSNLFSDSDEEEDEASISRQVARYAPPVVEAPAPKRKDATRALQIARQKMYEKGMRDRVSLLEDHFDTLVRKLEDVADVEFDHLDVYFLRKSRQIAEEGEELSLWEDELGVILWFAAYYTYDEKYYRVDAKLLESNKRYMIRDGIWLEQQAKREKHMLEVQDWSKKYNEEMAVFKPTFHLKMQTKFRRFSNLYLQQAKEEEKNKAVVEAEEEEMFEEITRRMRDVNIHTLSARLRMTPEQAVHAISDAEEQGNALSAALFKLSIENDSPMTWEQNIVANDEALEEEAFEAAHQEFEELYSSAAEKAAELAEENRETVEVQREGPDTTAPYSDISQEELLSVEPEFPEGAASHATEISPHEGESRGGTDTVTAYLEGPELQSEAVVDDFSSGPSVPTALLLENEEKPKGIVENNHVVLLEIEEKPKGIVEKPDATQLAKGVRIVKQIPEKKPEGLVETKKPLKSLLKPAKLLVTDFEQHRISEPGTRRKWLSVLTWKRINSKRVKFTDEQSWPVRIYTSFDHMDEKSNDDTEFGLQRRSYDCGYSLFYDAPYFHFRATFGNDGWRKCSFETNRVGTSKKTVQTRIDISSTVARPFCPLTALLSYAYPDTHFGRWISAGRVAFDVEQQEPFMTQNLDNVLNFANEAPGLQSQDVIWCQNSKDLEERPTSYRNMQTKGHWIGQLAEAYKKDQSWFWPKKIFISWGIDQFAAVYQADSDEEPEFVAAEVLIRLLKDIAQLEHHLISYRNMLVRDGYDLPVYNEDVEEYTVPVHPIAFYITTLPEVRPLADYCRCFNLALRALAKGWNEPADPSMPSIKVVDWAANCVPGKDLFEDVLEAFGRSVRDHVLWSEKRTFKMPDDLLEGWMEEDRYRARMQRRVHEEQGEEGDVEMERDEGDEEGDKKEEVKIDEEKHDRDEEKREEKEQEQEKVEDQRNEEVKMEED